MAFRKLLFLVSFFLHIILAKFTCAESELVSEEAMVLEDHNGVGVGAVSPSEDPKLELDRLKSKISSLETSIEDRTGELERMDGGLKDLEKFIVKKSIRLASLQSTFRSVQEQGSSVVKDQIGEVNTRVDELQKQIVNLRKDIEAQNKKKDKLEAQANVAEEKIKELNLKLDNLLRINDEQKSRIHNAQHALEVAEEEMLKAKLEASLMIKQLTEVRQAWLPAWLSAHLVNCQEWLPTIKDNYKSFMDDLHLLVQWLANKTRYYYHVAKSSIEPQIVEMQDLMDPYVQEWLPIIKEHCMSVMDDFRFVVQSLANKAIYYLHVAKSSIVPKIVEMQEIINPYIQETIKFVKPYIDRVHAIVKPYLGKVVSYSRKITETVQIYHSQVQATLCAILNSYELTKPLVKGSLAQVMASISLLLLVFLRILAPNEPKKRSRIRRRVRRK